MIRYKKKYIVKVSSEDTFLKGSWSVPLETMLKAKSFVFD